MTSYSWLNFGGPAPPGSAVGRQFWAHIVRVSLSAFSFCIVIKPDARKIFEWSTTNADARSKKHIVKLAIYANLMEIASIF